MKELDDVNKGFNETLVKMIDDYRNSEVDLTDIRSVCRRIEDYNRNEGIHLDRLAYNLREQSFHDEWLKVNIPFSWINHGHGILQDLFIEGSSLNVLKPKKVVESINERDRMIVATVIQWLGTNVGMCFLGNALKRFNARIVYNSDEPK